MWKKINPNVKCCVFVVGFLIACIFLKLGITQYSKGHRIKWQNRAVEMEIKRNMGSYGDIWTKQAADWPRDLELIGPDIQNLEDLKYFTNLERLYLRETSVTDLSVLESMKHLKVLIIEGGSLKNLGPLSQVDTLIYIALKDLPVSSIQPLSGLENLEELSLSGLAVGEIPEWKGKALEKVEIKDLPVNTISAFSNKNIWSIYLENTEIKDIEAVNSMPDLQYLTVINSPIEKMPDLSFLSELKAVEIRNTNIFDLPEFPDVLQELKLGGNLIDNFNLANPLSNLCTLEISNIPADCKLSDMNFWQMCPNIINLNLSNDYIVDLKEIKSFTFLNRLDISNNRVENFDGLGQMNELRELNLSGINLNDIQLQEVLSGLHLRVLEVSSCNLDTLDFLKDSLKIKELHAADNKIQNIDVLKELNDLNDLDISNNPITDLTPLIGKEVAILNVSGIDLGTINRKQGEDVLGTIAYYTLVASNCNLNNLDFLHPGMLVANIYIPDNFIWDLSIFKDRNNWVKRLDISGNLVTEEDLIHQLDVVMSSPGIYCKYGFDSCFQIKLEKDSEFLEDIIHYKP